MCRPCPLKPGSCDYQIHLASGGDATAGGIDSPQLTPSAKIVVE